MAGRHSPGRDFGKARSRAEGAPPVADGRSTEIRDLRRSGFRGQRLVKLLAVAFAKLGAMRLTAELGSGSV